MSLQPLKQSTMTDDNNVHKIERASCDLIYDNILIATKASWQMMGYNIHTTTKWVMMDDSSISMLALGMAYR